MKILVLAGGYDQIALINELKSRGHEVILADFLECPPAKKYADKHFVVSTLDETSILKLAINEKVNLITTACTDQALLTVANVSEKLDLPCYVDSNTARNVTNKAYMKKVFYENEIPTANFAIVDNNKLVLNAIREFKFPLVVKPCDCNSSKGVTKVNDNNELMKAYNSAMELSRSKKVIIESFLEGIEVSIDIWNDNEGSKVLAVSETCKIKDNTDNFTIYKSKYPVNITPEMKTKIQNAADRIADSFNLHNCPVLIQAIINNDEINVVEFSARMGGGSKYKLIEYMSGIDIMKLYVNRVLGDETQIVTPHMSRKSIELNYVYAYNGVYDKLINFESYVNNGTIRELFEYKIHGAEINKRNTSSDRIAGFLIEGDSKDEVDIIRRNIIENVDIIDCNGNSIMFKECYF